MPTPTVVKAVSVTAYCHSPLHQPRNGVSSSGTSEIKWTFKGTYSANDQCHVVIQAEKGRNGRGSNVNSAKSGGVFPEGQDGTYCELTLEENDLDNWTVSVATDKDVSAEKEVIFRGGTGGGGL